MATAECEVWILVDENGDYVAHHDAGSLSDLYDEQIGCDRDTTGIRFVKLTVKVPTPEVIELAGEVTAKEEVGALVAVAGAVVSGTVPTEVAK